MARKRSKEAKKRSATRRPNGHIWSNTHRLELLAFLNWCVQHNKIDHFSTLVIRHLMQATSKRFTKLQVQQKLDREWRRHGMCKKFVDLYSLGTAGFKPFRAEDQREFDLISLRLENHPPKVGRFLRSALLAPSTQRHAERAPTRQIREEEVPPPPLSLPKSQEVKGSRYRTRSQIRYFSLGEEQEARLGQDELPRADNVDVANDDASELFSRRSFDPEPDRLNTILQSQEADSLSETQPPPSPSLETKLRIAEEKLLKAQGRELTLMNRVSELEADLKDRDHCERSEPIDPVEARRQISRLKIRVTSLEKLVNSFQIMETERFAFSGSSLNSECRCLYRKINTGTIFPICDLSLDDDLPEQRSGFSQLAQSWARRIFGGDMSALLTYAHDADIAKHKLVAAILTAGICDVVFESDFPEMLSIDSPFFNEYRRLVSISAGRDKAHNIELAAIKQVFTNEQVKNRLIHDKARCLSSIILPTLDFFMPSSSHDMSERLFDNLSNDEKSAVTALEYGLAHALKIKVELTLSDKRIKYFFFKPGTLFDGAMMECDISQIRAPVNGRLKLCVFPALFSVPDGDGENQEGQGSRFGGHDGGMTEAMASDLESLVLVAKARVLF